MKQEKWDKLHKELDNALNTIKKNKMKVEKKKVVGLRKKKIFESPLQVDWQYAHNVIAEKDESIKDLENRLDEAYKEQEQMLKEVDKWVFKVIHHCAEVQSKTGRITLHDVDYCIDLIKRIMKHKFESKPENC
jgi:CRISPR/Cas system CMR subunit Cmr6 (Cas7 group RAMP superfamily)